MHRAGQMKQLLRGMQRFQGTRQGAATEGGG